MRKAGHSSTSYIDDCVLVSLTEKECKQNIEETVSLTLNSGFVVHPTKSVLSPTQRILFLGFWLDSNTMKVKLKENKAAEIKRLCLKLLKKETITIQKLAQVVGKMVSSFPWVPYGQMYFRHCDNHKTLALKQAKGNFAATTRLPTQCINDLRWWADNIENEERDISIPDPKFTLETDASKNGWGGCIVSEQGRVKTGGHWSVEESTAHINKLELLAALFTLKSLCGDARNCHIKILSDNTTTVVYINNQGGTKPKCNEVARQIWDWCYQTKNWVSATHLPGTLNTVADEKSRSIHDNNEWHLSKELFQKLCQIWGTPEIDLFANRLNNQVPRFFAWKPDPSALAIDAMSENWPYSSFMRSHPSI